MSDSYNCENGNGDSSAERRPIFVVRIPKREIATLQKSEKFILILRLCRYRNQMLCCEKNFLDYALDTSPYGTRHRFNAIWFLCAVLNEAERVIPELGKEFRHFRSYQEGFASFLRDTKLTELRKRLFTPLRNQLVSHVDNKAIAKSLSTFDVNSYEFVSWSPGSHLDFSYELADELVLNAFIESDENHSSKRWPFEELYADVLGYLRHYSHCADDLIKEYLDRKGWRAVEDSAFYERKDEDDVEEFSDHMRNRSSLDDK